MASALLVLAACQFTPGTTSADSSVVDTASIDARKASVDASPDAPAPIRLDCLDAFQHGITTDGVIQIDPDGAGGNPPFDVYCDMTTSGGGWTLVWVYGFTSYNNFSSGGNAVTPRPTWSVPTIGGTPTSTTVPLAPTTPGALDYARWASLGGNLLVESNINHWITCAPGSGSLVTPTNGTMTCSIVKKIATACTTIVPTWFAMDNVAAGLFASSTNPLSTYYFWESSTTTLNWPTHDPCGANSTSQLTGIPNPYGSIYLHR